MDAANVTKPCHNASPSALNACTLLFPFLSHTARNEEECAVVQVKDYKEDPLNFVGKVRARTGNELLKVLRSRVLQADPWVTHQLLEWSCHEWLRFSNCPANDCMPE